MLGACLNVLGLSYKHRTIRKTLLRLLWFAQQT